MRSISLTLMLLALSALAQESNPVPSPAEAEAIRVAAARGKALYEAFTADPPQRSSQIDAARTLIKDFCPDLNYRAVTVQEDSAPVVYFIGTSKSPGSVVFGRHYRISGWVVSPSTKACASIPAPKDKPAVTGTVITHLLSDTPSEFHVFESYLNQLPIFVMTRVGAWKIQHGEIQILARDAKSVAPVDRPAPLASDRLAEQEREFAPLIAKARASYPEARERFLNGLAPGEKFAVVTRLTDTGGRFEQVFVAVRSIHEGRIEGRITSQIELVAGYKYGDAYAFSESDLLDWVISKPDGSEDGNLIGKYLDSKR